MSVIHRKNHEVTLKFKDRCKGNKAFKFLMPNEYEYKASGISDYEITEWKENNVEDLCNN